ncbi:MAG: Tm-1-like ATP-binding domain-containing protein [Hyphomicrobiaceae bacterium]|nr:Tm-1-like ATP-binding domain-containing protein [Hyphomicrobiaceae bacterium]
MPAVCQRAYVVGTCDTKGEELGYVRDLLERAGLQTVLVDVGVSGEPALAADVGREEVARRHPEGAQAVLGQRDRGRAVSAMADAFCCFIAGRNDIGGIIGLGGSGGTAIIAPAMRSLPLGTPKLMISTMASGYVAPHVGSADICMLYAVTDILGLNSISAQVLANGAHALAGMMRHHAPPRTFGAEAIGLTMFGVTTPAVARIVGNLRDRFDCLVFHANGAGGRTMEALVDRHKINAVIDLTTTEVADLVLGGHQPADPDRLGAIARTRVPYVGSCGALDMVNFGALSTVPAHYKERHLHSHNPHVTLMRTGREDNRRIGEWIGAKLNACAGQVRFLLPLGGVSAIDAPGEPFHDPEADAALFEALRRTVRITEQRKLIDVPHHINDPAFAAAVVAQFEDVMKAREQA